MWRNTAWEHGEKYSLGTIYCNNHAPHMDNKSLFMIREKGYVSVTNLSSENNLPTFRLNARVVIRVKDDDWSIQSKCQQVIFRTQVGNR